MNSCRTLLALGILCLLPPAEGADPLLELTVENSRFLGRIVQHTDDRVWLQRPDGRMDDFEIGRVSDYQQRSATFRPISQVELKSQLQKEFGSRYQVAWKGIYLVVGRPGMAERYAEMFDELHRDFVGYFGPRGFPMREAPFPLVAICFATRDEFVADCEQEGVKPPPGAVGVYRPKSNRVALFEQENATAVDDTVIHEATHQLAFNLGLHSRIGRNPRWLVEGLAQVFENPSFRKPSRTESPRLRVNRVRFEHARTMKVRVQEKSLTEAMIRSDVIFGVGPADAYALSWGLSFFLAETRPSQFADYVRQVGKRPTTEEYTPEQRMSDFKVHFGQDLALLDTHYLRFLRELQK